MVDSGGVRFDSLDVVALSDPSADITIWCHTVFDKVFRKAFKHTKQSLNPRRAFGSRHIFMDVQPATHVGSKRLDGKVPCTLNRVVALGNVVRGAHNAQARKHASTGAREHGSTGA